MTCIGSYSCWLTVCAAIYTEYLFKKKDKNDDTFLEQQFWLYLYGMFTSLVLHIINNPAYGPIDTMQSFHDISLNVYMMLCFSMVITSCGGIVIATILKFLDNIVKEYSGSMANVITAIVCNLLFPNKFQVS